MVAVAGLTNVQSRIGLIQQRLGLQATTGMYDSEVSGELVPPDPTDGFDPFGALYQEALAAAQPPPSLSTPVVSRVQAYAAGVVTAPTSAFVPTGVPGASVGRIGGFGPMPVPDDLAAYGNGRIPSGVLAPIGQGGHQLWGPAAEAWKSAVAAASADGVTLQVTDSYRSYDQQVDLAARKGLYADGGYAAVPGTSNHGWGLAVDIDVSDPATQAWVRANGYRFGFVEAVPREPWHWEYRPQQA